MPEGPEVKITSDYLNIELKDEIITKFNLLSDPYNKKYKRLIKSINLLLPIKFHTFFCIGKKTFTHLKNNKYFAYHLGMTGHWSKQKEKHAHLCLETLNKKIYFHDTRRFGNIKLIQVNNIEEKYYAYRDLLNYNKLEEHQDSLLKLRSNIDVCKILLNQKYFPGVGNYLKSEILYKTKIHPHSKWNVLTNLQIKNLCINTRNIMHECYNLGGAELRDFKNPKKSSSLKLMIYGKKITSKGNKVINFISSDNRRTYVCLKTQKIYK